ncbi:putative polysaccharide biosynthesis protein [Fusibacter sp. JL216-2]|uniref:putative polysaccharide biosynthesis protein n=1 Tax=Fusibacter sp. JL216-2 TaxID=3071453 RepID=UPI003D32E71A
MKRQSFIKGSLILMILGFISRAFGVFFKVPLDYLVGEEGQGLYYILYPVYAAFIAMSSVGLTMALSKQIAEYRATKKDSHAWMSFKLAFGLFLGFGLIMTIVLFAGVNHIITLLKWPEETYWGLIGLGAAPLIVSIMSAFRGLFQGHENMVPTGVSMIIEQFARVVFGIGLTWFFMDKYNDIGLAVGGATFGAAAGGLFATIYLVTTFMGYKKHIIVKDIEIGREEKKIILKKLLSMAVPIAMGSAIISVMGLVDSVMLPAALTELTGDSHDALELIGGYSRANTIMNIPLIISLSISTSIVPFVAKAWELKEFDVVHRRIGMGMKMGTLLAFPAAVGIAVLSHDLIGLIFSSTIGGQVLIPLAFALVFIIYSQIQTNVLNAIGKPVVPVRNMLLGVAVKVLLNLILVPNPNFGLMGAGYAVITAYMVTTYLNSRSLNKYTGYSFDVKKLIRKPTLSVFGMWVGLVVTGIVFDSLLPDRIVTLISVSVGAIIYGLLIIKQQYLDQAEISQIPVLQKIENLLVKK